MRQMIVQQFKRPRGPLGRLAGWIMAHRDSNLRRNAWTVSLLGIEPHHHVLEVGCGPGVALAHAAELATQGRVVGLDHSALMVESATKRNAQAIAEGRVEVLLGSAELAIELDRRFDRVFAVNVAQFWDAPVKTLTGLRAVTKPGGIIAIAFQPRNQGATDEDAHQGADRNVALLTDAGFKNARIETLDLHPAATCVLAEA